MHRPPTAACTPLLVIRGHLAGVAAGRRCWSWSGRARVRGSLCLWQGARVRRTSSAISANTNQRPMPLSHPVLLRLPDLCSCRRRSASSCPRSTLPLPPERRAVQHPLAHPLARSVAAIRPPTLRFHDSLRSRGLDICPSFLYFLTVAESKRAHSGTDWESIPVSHLLAHASRLTVCWRSLVAFKAPSATSSLFRHHDQRSRW